MAEIDTYFKALKNQGASDLHMVIGFPPFFVTVENLCPLTTQS